MTAKQDEKNQKIIRQLLTLPENKKCADCTAKGPVYANTTFHTFVCTACSGIHREFNHRVKSISMASFKPEEIKALQDGGNKVANDTYLARWNPDDFREPDPADVDKLRQWIKLKYIEKRWIVGGSNPTSPSKGAQRQPNQGQTQQASARQPAQQTSQPNLFQQQPQQQQAKPQQNMVLDTSLFAAQPTQQPQQASTPFDPFGHNAQPQQQQGHELSGLMFPSQEQQQAFQQQQQQQQQHQQQQKKTTDLLSQLGNMYQQSAMQQQQMAMLQQQQLYQQMMQQQQQPQPQGQPNPFGQNPQFAAQQNPQFAQPNPFGQNPQFAAQQNPQFAQNPQMAQNAQFAAFGMAPQQQAQPTGQFPFGAQPAQPQGNPFGMPIAQQAPAQHGGWGAPQQHVELDSYGLPVGQNPYLQAQTSAPVHQEPPKADPFASLTSLASNIKAKPKQTSTPSPSPAMTPAPVPVSSQPAQQEDDIFGGFSSPVATQSAPQHENPFGFTEAPQQQQQQQAPADFNPFF